MYTLSVSWAIRTVMSLASISSSSRSSIGNIVKDKPATSAQSATSPSTVIAASGATNNRPASPAGAASVVVVVSAPVVVGVAVVAVTMVVVVVVVGAAVVVVSSVSPLVQDVATKASTPMTASNLDFIGCLPCLLSPLPIGQRRLFWKVWPRRSAW